MTKTTTARETAIQFIPLCNISTSPTNPRKNFNEESLNELASSIKEKGVLQPILVRPAGNIFELVAGERRFRAAMIADLADIPAIVRDLDDRAALEVQVIENLQREDLSVMEEAEGYRALIDEHSYTAEQLAEKLHKSKAYVYGRLKLTELPQLAKSALVDGELSMSVAQLIARIPNEELRKRASTDLYRGWDKTFCSYREAKSEIERSYMVELKGAPFSRKDVTLVPSAGACDWCPKLTGNNRDEYPDGRADVCTDPGCFKQKVEAHHNRQLEKAEQKGFQVLPAKQSEKLFSKWSDGLDWQARNEWVDLSEQCAGNRTFKDLVGDKVTPTAAVDRKGAVHLLAPRAEVAKIIKADHKIEIDGGHRATNIDSKKIQQQVARQRELRRLVVSLACQEVRNGIAQKIAGHPEILSEILADLMDSLYFDGLKILLESRGHSCEDSSYNTEDLIGSMLQKSTPLEALALLVECGAGQKIYEWAEFDRGRTPKWIGLLGVDLKVLEQRAKQEAAAAKKTEPKKTSKKKVA
jgi:ParB/RepB/Spo0J family partition protein